MLAPRTELYRVSAVEGPLVLNLKPRDSVELLDLEGGQVCSLSLDSKKTFLEGSGPENFLAFSSTHSMRLELSVPQEKMSVEESIPSTDLLLKVQRHFEESKDEVEAPPPLAKAQLD